MGLLKPFLLILTIVLAMCHCDEAKKRGNNECPAPGLGAIVAQQNQVLIELMRDIQSLTNQMSNLKDVTKAEIKDVEDKLEATNADLQATKTELQSTKMELQSVKAELKSLRDKLKDLEEKLREIEAQLWREQGSTYIRWGQDTCPDNKNTSLVYSGYVAGKHYTHKGSGTNPLCLTKSPLYDAKLKPASTGLLYGAEYESVNSLQDREIPCSVCHTNHSSTVMIPGTRICPDEWTVQYKGYLASAHASQFANQFSCLDEDPESVNGSAKLNSNGFLFYLVASKCGSLPCPPFIDNRVVTCVVCSK